MALTDNQKAAIIRLAATHVKTGKPNPFATSKATSRSAPASPTPPKK